MDKSKYFFTFEEFISKIDNLDKIKVPKGYKQIDAQKNTKKSTKHKKTKSR